MNARKFFLSVASLYLTNLLPPAAYAEFPTFAWPVPSRVTVTETTLKKGKTAKTRYDIVLRNQKSGGDLELKFENFHFLELNGIDLTSAEAKKNMGPTLVKINAAGSMIPTLVITPQGTVKDVTGIDEMIEGYLKIAPGPSDPKQLEQMKASMHSPAMIETMKAKSTEFWKVWVETWLAADAAPGGTQTLDREIPIAGGEIVKTLIKLSSESAPTGATGSVKLSAQAILQGDAAKSAMKELMIIMNSAVPAGVKPLTPESVKDLKRVEKFSVVTNPKTLQPTQASWETTTDLTIDTKQITQIEKHDYSFKWLPPPPRVEAQQ